MLLALAFPGAQNVPIHASPSLAVIGFAFGLSLVTGVCLAWRPRGSRRMRSRPDALRQWARSTATGASCLQRGLVVRRRRCRWCCWWARDCLSQSLNKLQRTDMKLDAKNRYIVHVEPAGGGIFGDHSWRRWTGRWKSVSTTCRSIVKVGMSTYPPMENDNEGWGVDNKAALTVANQSATLRQGKCGVPRLSRHAYRDGTWDRACRTRRRPRRWRW